MNSPRSSDHGHVQRFILAMVREAEHQAELVARFLIAQGLSVGEPCRESETPMPEVPAASFLLSIGTALRLRQLENGGLRDRIAPNAPSAVTILMEGAAAMVQGNVGTEKLAAINAQLILNSLWSGRWMLGVDVPLPQAIPDREQLIEALAAYLLPAVVPQQ